jgi:hypothetical protein
MAEQDGETDVEAVYRQEQLREQGRSPGGREQPIGPPADGSRQESPDDESVQAKAKRFLAKHKRSTSSTSSNNSSVSVPIVNNSACSNSVYDTIHSLKLKTLDAPSLYGGASGVSKDIGSFKLNGEAAMGAPFEKKVFGQKKIVTFSFDPQTLVCGVCTDEHQVMGEGKSDNPIPKIFVLADQGFPGGVVPAPGGGCVAVIRRECGSLADLTDLFCEVTAGCDIPAGSVILLSSLSHLADVGVQSYAEDLSRAVNRLARTFRGGLMVLPGILFPPVEMSDPGLIRSLADILCWFAKISSVTEGGGPVLSECYSQLVDLLRSNGTGTELATYGVRYRLPHSLGGGEYQKWDSGGATGLKSGVAPPDPAGVIRIVNVLFNELHTNLGMPNLTMAGLYGASQTSAFKKKVILVGASHMKRLEAILQANGVETARVATKHWRAVTTGVNNLTQEIKLMLGLDNAEEAVLVLGMFDNAFFQARYEDGNYCPISKRIDGSYHVDGDIVCPAMETSRTSFIQTVPLLKTFQEYDKLVLAPLPRYLYNSCCSDVEHAPNIKEDNHVAGQIGDLEEHQRMWRGISFREKIRNVKVVSAASLLADATWWGTDPVHPTNAGYERVAKFVLQGLRSMEAKREDFFKAEEAKEGRKRPLNESPPSSSQTDMRAKRGPWQSTGDYVVRQEQPWGAYRGRGGRGGRGGWPRGRGGQYFNF